MAGREIGTEGKSRVSWMRRKAWVRVSGPKGHGRRLGFEVEKRVEWLWHLLAYGGNGP